MNYIIDFENYFPNSKKIKLNLNYRSTQYIVGGSNEVIRHNKFKVAKEIYVSKISERQIILYSGNNDEENIQFCFNKVRKLLADELTNHDILFLYRRSKRFSP